MNDAMSPKIAQPGMNDDNDDVDMDEENACNSIPIANFKSNNIHKKERYIQTPGMMSPGGIM